MNHVNIGEPDAHRHAVCMHHLVAMLVWMAPRHLLGGWKCSSPGASCERLAIAYQNQLLFSMCFTFLFLISCWFE